MNSRFAYLIGAFAVLPFAHAAEQSEVGRYLATPLKGDYYIYGGTLGDKTSPSLTDTKVSIMLVGKLARDLFEHIGPDAKSACSSGPEYRERRRGDLICTWTKADGHSCYIGINANTGRSMRGSTC